MFEWLSPSIYKFSLNVFIVKYLQRYCNIETENKREIISPKLIMAEWTQAKQRANIVVIMARFIVAILGASSCWREDLFGKILREFFLLKYCQVLLG